MRYDKNITDRVNHLEKCALLYHGVLLTMFKLGLVSWEDWVIRRERIRTELYNEMGLLISIGIP